MTDDDKADYQEFLEWYKTKPWLIGPDAQEGYLAAKRRDRERIERLMAAIDVLKKALGKCNDSLNQARKDGLIK